jgi:NAD(P)-dependent dehydrogenase (short-subunit alcohol dehydrogenase family)
VSLLLEGKAALVTGATRGLGRQIARTLAREGADVAFNYVRSDAEAVALVAEVEALGRRALPFKVSVLDKAGVGDMVLSVERAWGAVDVLVNNAGVGQVVPLVLMEEEDWDRMLGVNVKGAFLVSQAVLRGMIRRRRGRIINISSLAGVKMMQAPVHYAAAKAALRGLSEALAKEVGRYGVTVNCLAPGILEEGVSVNLPAAKREDYLKNCALGRVGTFAEIAEVAAFLASDRNSYMNGATVVLDGAV